MPIGRNTWSGHECQLVKILGSWQAYHVVYSHMLINVQYGGTEADWAVAKHARARSEIA
jgi:hypothetical protein